MRRATLAGLAVLISAHVAAAQDSAGKVVPAPSAALAEASAALDAAWDAAGLSFSVATFTDGPSAGFGQYTPRPTNVFNGEETITVYAEPVGYRFASDGSSYSYKLDAGFRLLNTSGQVLAEQENFAGFSGSGRTRQRELSTGLSFEFGGLPAGAYVLETRFSDANGAGSAAFTLPFSVTKAE